MVKVRRVVATYDIGTLLNNKTGVNQLMGGITWGVSFALCEQAHIDPVYGRVVNESLAEYHVPVNADIGTIDVTVLNVPDGNSILWDHGVSVRLGLLGPRPLLPMQSTTQPASESGSIRLRQIKL